MGLSDLPLADGKAHKKVFESLGWIVRKESTHIILTHPAHFGVNLSIPNHREVKRGTLKSLVRDAGLTDQKYRNFFDNL
ncbi:MAG: type II toxin-antitoxin system HicA family toxin [Acidobacteriota bacterium]|nr:type II toxin-antitoxin system HicA family toxin [Acidobacteriota bacterium]